MKTSHTQTETETAKILADETLSNAERRDALTERKAALWKKKQTFKTRAKFLSVQEKALEEIEQWAKGKIKAFGVKTSKLHKLAEGIIIDLGSDNYILPETQGCQTFLMQHNWRAVIEGTEASHGEFRLPHHLNAFEFNLNNRHVILHGSSFPLDVYVETQNCWVMMGNTETFELHGEYVRALCILLEAQAIEAEVIRAPHRLNAAREKRGKLPIYDHHILKLANRKRYGHLEPSGNERASPRLHFRRGHWRHYQGHKTWIAWQLVGDASLGFADKDYAY